MSLSLIGGTNRGARSLGVHGYLLLKSPRNHVSALEIIPKNMRSGHTVLRSGITVLRSGHTVLRSGLTDLVGTHGFEVGTYGSRNGPCVPTS